MEAAAHNPAFAAKAGVPVKVAKEFVAADKKHPTMRESIVHAMKGKKSG
ncbi:MAG: hypothetical protein JSR64_22170 [Nitrospira sp.]|nr:hypothetical protein [Nitrospira sp.]